MSTQQKIQPQSKRLILLARQESSLAAAGEKFLEAWRCDPENTQLALLVAMELSDLSLQDKAIDLLQEFVQSNPLSKEILQVAAKIAMEIEAFGVAAKLYQQVIGFDPSDESSYELLVTALRLDEQFDPAIELLQELLPVFPNNARLWLGLGQTLDHKNGVSGESKAFFEQAYELAPTDYQVLTEYANALQADTEAGPIYEQALAVNPDGIEANLGMAISEFSRGNLEKAWQHYEFRLDPKRRADETASYQVDAPVWKGQSLAGKSLLVMAEQGIGDEVFFAANFGSLMTECKQLFIGCEPRLVSIFERSFPDAVVGAFEDVISGGKRKRSFPTIHQHLRQHKIRLDYAVPFGSACGQRWHSLDDIPTDNDGYLKADPERIAAFEDMCRPSKTGNLKVGISWQSGKLSKGRKHSYPGLEGLLPILRQPNIDFFVLQYAYESEILDSFSLEFGIDLRRFDDIDLKADIEANLAIMEHMDVVIGPPIATQSFAAAAGRPVFMICDGLPWTAFGQKNGRIPAYPSAMAFPKIANSWGRAYDKLRLQLDQQRSQATEARHRPSHAITQIPENWVKELRSDFREIELTQPMLSDRKKNLDAFFARLSGKRVGFCWDVDFFAEEALHEGEAFLLMVDAINKWGVEAICLHANVTRSNAHEFVPHMPDRCHFFEEFNMIERFSFIESVFDNLDLVIGPESFVTLTAILHGTKTAILSDEAAWDLANDLICRPVEDSNATWYDFRAECRESSLLEVSALL